MVRQLTAIIAREDDMYVALCPELDIASQGDTVAEARDNLQEALELFCETASKAEIRCRLQKSKEVNSMRQVVLYPGEDGYWVAECPSLPGCVSQGRNQGRSDHQHQRRD